VKTFGEGRIIIAVICVLLDPRRAILPGEG